MYIGVKFEARREIIKCVLILLGLNVERKERFCIITDEAFKVKRLYVKLIIVLLILFLSRNYKLMRLFPFRPGRQTHREDSHCMNLKKIGEYCFGRLKRMTVRCHLLQAQTIR